MTKFIKSVHGNVSAAGRYFMEGYVVPIEDELAKHDEIQKMASGRYLKIFDTEKAALVHKFRGIAERFQAGEDVSAPVLDDKATEEKNKAEAAAEVERLKVEAAAKVKADEEAAAEVERLKALTPEQLLVPVVETNTETSTTGTEGNTEVPAVTKKNQDNKNK